MKKRLILSGPIGCGKSTMIRNALGEAARNAGGYVTLRVLEQDRLLGFDLAPASVLAAPEANLPRGRFLDFTQGRPVRDPAVFSGLGRKLLEEASACPYGVADEFGGIELLIPEFREALESLLASQVPCIGVLKTQAASQSMVRHLDLEADYGRAYEEFCQKLYQDPDTEILQTTGRYDDAARHRVEAWVREYVRK